MGLFPTSRASLKAVGYDGDKIVNQTSLNTASNPVNIKLSTDRKILKADNEDLSYITVELVDNKGNINPKAENLVSFSIIGDGKIVGVGNANPVSLESFERPQRQVWKGKCLVIIKAGKTSGKILLKVNSTGLKADQITISTQK